MSLTPPTWLVYILQDEGSELTLGDSEPGGASRYGVSVSALSDYNRLLMKPPATVQDIINLTQDQAVSFYMWFFTSMRLIEMPDAIAYRVADITTNLGRVGGMRSLQVALGIWPVVDLVGDNVIASIKNTDPKQVICSLTAAWLACKYYSPKSAADWGKDGHGWTNRANNAHNRALGMVK